MKSHAKTVDQYMSDIPTVRKQVMNQLRKACLQLLIGYEESMEYGMPCYKKKGLVDVAFASQKNYISLYFLKNEVIQKNKHLLNQLDVGKSCIRYKKLEQLDFAVIHQLLEATAQSITQPC